MKKGYLVLEDGTVLEGLRFGWEGDAVGELVFTTGMCGYPETLTDPSYEGQIVVQTFPMIGNYGMIPADFEGGCFVRGYVVREACSAPSNFRCEQTLDSFLKQRRVPGLCGVDTRALTRLLREHGVMNAMLCSAVPESTDAVRSYAVTDALQAVTVRKKKVLLPQGEEKFHVALLDYGAKNNILRELNARGCRVSVLPADTSAEDVLALCPDGIMLSNGPGDPAEDAFQIRQLQKLMGVKPIFGICLGHQLLALANGARTYKLKYGHRGVNQPVREAEGQRTYITSQNHGYAVDSSTVKSGRVSFYNANDGTNEGIEYDRAFTVQFHPEACSGPKDTSFLFDRFVRMMEEEKACR